MSKPYRSFLVVNTGTPQYSDDHKLSLFFQGTRYREDDLREWAEEEFDITEEYTLEDIARDIREGGWLLYEGIWPSKNEMDKTLMEKISEGFQGDLEVCADDVASAFKGLAQYVDAKTEVTEVKANKAVITVTVRPKPGRK